MGSPATPSRVRRMATGDGVERNAATRAGTLMVVEVKPSARVSRLEQIEDGTWRAHLKSPPVDGKANEELLALVAGHVGCRKTAVSIKSGASARRKILRIEA